MTTSAKISPADKKRPIRLLKFPLTARGVTDLILREAVSDLQPPDFSQVLYVAPTPRKLRDAQRRFHRLVESPYIPPRFVTLKQLARSFFASGGGGRTFPDTLVPLLISEMSDHTIGYSGILSDILKELRQHHPSKDLHSLHHELRDIFLRKGLPDDMVRKLGDAMEVFSRLREGLSAGGYTGEDDLLIRSAGAAGDMQGTLRVLLLDGFYEMTNAEINLTQALIGKADSVIITYPYLPAAGAAEERQRPVRYLDLLRSGYEFTEEEARDSRTPDLSYVRYNSIEDEVEGVARHIKNLYLAGGMSHTDQVVLTVPGLHDYRPLLERVLTRYGLPFNMALQRSFAEQGPVRDLLCLLESTADDFPRRTFTTFLNSPHFTKIPGALRRWIPTVSLKSGIVKGRESWINLNPEIAPGEVLGPVVLSLKKLFGILAPLADRRENATPGTYRGLISELLEELGFDAGEALGRKLTEAFEILEAVPSLSGRREISLARYADFLRHILNASEYAPDAEGIQVMEFPETRGLEPDHLYFCGLRDGDMPSKPPVDHLLPDSIRREYGLTDLNTYLHTQKVYFQRIAGASLHRHLSYPSLEGDTVFLQSPYLSWGNEVREKVFGILSEDELQKRKGFRPFEEYLNQVSLGKKTIGRILKKELAMPLRVTDVDAFRKCPRRFFIEKVLRLEATRITEYEIEARLLGTIFHKVMEELFSDPVKTGLSSDGMLQRASSIFDTAAARYYLEPYWRQLLKAAFLEVLPEILDLEAKFREEGFVPFSLELEIKKEEVLPGISLKGKIDRIDSDGRTFRIIDYKTGAADIGSSIIKSGKGLQLPLYAAMLRARGVEVQKAGIYSLNTVGIKWIPTSRDKYEMDDYIDSALGYLKETVGVMQSGDFASGPLEDFFCSSCAECPFCPNINLASGNVAPSGSLSGGSDA